jgi:hypothetical protein
MIIRRIRKINTVPTGGDDAGVECSKCESRNTIFEEYIKPNVADESELGIKCQDCDHEELPDEYHLRFEPSYVNENEDN